MKAKVFLFGFVFMLFGSALLVDNLWAKTQQLCCNIVIVIDDTLNCPMFPTPYPNPSSDGLHLNFYSEFSGNTEISAVDANGNAVYLLTQTLSGGEEIVLPSDTWEEGVYNIKVSANGCTRRIVAEVYR